MARTELTGRTENILDAFLNRWRRGSRGPLPQLTDLQVLTALLVISEIGPVGRRILSEELGIKNGVVRGLLERLAEQDMLTVTSLGVELSKKGRSQLEKILEELSLRKHMPFESVELAPRTSAAAGKISQAYTPNLTGISQRDEAIKAGAMGAITMTVKEGKLLMPPDNRDVAELAPADNARLLLTFKPREKDVIMIGFGANRGRALAGMLAAIFSLQKRLKE